MSGLQKHIWGGDSRLGASEGRYVLASAPDGQLVAYAPASAPGHVTLITTPRLNVVKSLEVRLCVMSLCAAVFRPLDTSSIGGL